MGVPAELLSELRAVAHTHAQPEPLAANLATDLAAGFQHIDDVIVLLQPLRMAAEDDLSELANTLQRLAEKNFLTGTQPVGDGGIWTALLCGCASRGFGFHADLSESEGASASEALLAKRGACALVSTRSKAHMPLANFVERGGRFTAEAIGRVTAGDIRVRWMGETVFEVPGVQALTR